MSRATNFSTSRLTLAKLNVSCDVFLWNSDISVILTTSTQACVCRRLWADAVQRVCLCLITQPNTK
jgi:hypothetical protein